MLSIKRAFQRNSTFVRWYYLMNISNPKMKKDKNSSMNIAKKLQRKLAIQAGFYDRRFKEKVEKDKKEEESKTKARKKIRLDKELE